MKKVLTITALGCLVSGIGWAQIEGTWLSEKKDSKVQIYKTPTGEYEGKMVWIKDPKPEAQKLLNYVVFKNFKKNSEKEYKNGIILYPQGNEEKTVKGILTLKDEKTLSVKGYIGVPALGKSSDFTRVN